MIKVCVVITVLNESESLSQLLAALEKQTLSPNEVVIADGGSNDGSWQFLQNYAKSSKLKLKVFQKKGNRSIGRNYAIQKATHSVIAITDAGCVPHHDWLEQLVKTYAALKQQASDHSIVVAGYYDAKPKTAFEAAVVPYVLVMPDKVDPDHFLPATRSMLLDKSAWQEVGGFEPQLSHNEDYSFAKKLEANQTIKLGFTAKAKVTWIPRTNLISFCYMIYRFAKGDLQAHIIRPKVFFIFMRYLLLAVVSIWLAMTSWPLLFTFWLVSAAIYSLWAIAKNVRYVGQGWYWLPVLQVCSDFAIMVGSLLGIIHV